MPRHKKTQSVAYQPPNLFPVYRAQELSFAEREQFRKFIQSPLGVKLIKNAYCHKPSSFAERHSWGEHSQQVCVNQLHLMQGWELFEAAFFKQAEERISKPNQTITEQYQEPGT